MREFFIPFVVGFVVILIGNIYYKQLSFLLPLVLFVVGFLLGYIIKNFKKSLIFGIVTVIFGTLISSIVIFYYFEFSEKFLFYSALGAVGMFFGFGFGSSIYLRIKSRKEKIEKFEKIIGKKKK
ncbi:MAG: hypothetical protein ACK4YO_02185 [Candidatus Altarchaeaceae archaeon]